MLEKIPELSGNKDVYGFVLTSFDDFYDGLIIFLIRIAKIIGQHKCNKANN